MQITHVLLLKIHTRSDHWNFRITCPNSIWNGCILIQFPSTSLLPYMKNYDVFLHCYLWHIIFTVVRHFRLHRSWKLRSTDLRLHLSSRLLTLLWPHLPPSYQPAQCPSAVPGALVQLVTQARLVMLDTRIHQCHRPLSVHLFHIYLSTSTLPLVV